MEFEKAFDEFMGNKEYDDVESMLFSVVRAAFRAGWIAAGGNPPTKHAIIDFVDRK